MGILFKLVSKRGGITIPQQMRHEAGIVAGKAIDIENTNEGLLIKPHVPICRICGSIENVFQFRGGFEICEKCVGDASKELGQNGK
jgi:transcriptional pleiotropic regulator of transition state genes